MEKFKTVILTVLVAASLLQTFLFAYSTPASDTINAEDSKYIVSEQIGREEKVEQLLKPQQLILHFGGNQHTLLYPDSTFYTLIYERIQGRTFDGVQKMSNLLVDWAQARKAYKGVEIRFSEGIPLFMLEKMIHIRSETVFGDDKIKSIWIFTEEGREDVRSFLIGEDNNVIYESTKADLTAKDVDEFVGFGEYGVKYDTVDGRYYWPEKALPVVQYKTTYDLLTVDQMQKSLFFDPDNTRNLPERDGSEIYTDSKRGLQIRYDGRWMRYSDPIATADGENKMEENVYAAVQFINQHGGWSGKYLFLNDTELMGQGQGNTLYFQQYYGSYPILSSGNPPLGYMKLVVQKGAVSSYERSLINLSELDVEKESVLLYGGDILKLELEQYPRVSEIRSLFPAYRSVIADSDVLLMPVWGVELADGSLELLDDH